MVKISVEGGSDTILSSTTRVDTAVVVIGDTPHTLTVTTVRVLSQSPPLHSASTPIPTPTSAPPLSPTSPCSSEEIPSSV
eukprot:1190101-Prorocentrum_minimum.AAC.2